MAAVTRFEELLAWQKARALTREIYGVSRSEDFRRDFGLSTQAQRCAVSTMANIAEGFARGGSVEFRRFLDIAFGSCVELTSHLYVALDVGYVTQAEFDRLKASADEVARLIAGLKRGNAAAHLDRRTPHSALRTPGGEE